MSYFEDWSLVNLADCSRVVGGATPKTSEPEYWNGDIDWVTPKDISNLEGETYLDETPRKLTSLGLAHCSAEVLPAYSVLFSSRAPIGLVAINKAPVATNQGFKSFVPNRTLLDHGYLYHWLRSNRQYLESLGTGATFKELSKTAISKVQIPLPPIDEQKRIAAVLDKADALRRQRQESLQRTEDLLQSVFIDMFGDLRTNSKGFNNLPISHFVERLEGGRSVKPDSSTSPSTKLFILKVSAVTSGKFIPSQAKPLPLDYEPPESFFVRKGDLLISRANTKELVGANAIVTEQYSNLVLPDKLWRMVWRKPDELDPLFVHYLLKQNYVREQISERASGTSGSMKNISKPKLLSIEVPFPNRDLQKKFGKAVKSIWEVQLTIQESISEIDNLFASLQQRAFRGELDLSRVTIKEEVEEPQDRLDDPKDLIALANAKPSRKRRVSKAFQSTPTVSRELKKFDTEVNK